MAFRALHIGDLHFWRVPANPMHYWGKRLLGNANLLVRRRHQFRRELAGPLVERLIALEADWLLFSGDFTTTALPAEFEMAARALGPAATRHAGRLLAVPGNHDRYTARALVDRSFERHLAPILPERGWPWFVPLDDDVWAIGIDGGTRNGLSCHGRLKPGDVVAMRTWWRELEQRPRELVVLCHFPAEDPGGAWTHNRGPQLHEAGALLDFLGECGLPTWFLHGHHHHRWLYGSPRVPSLVYLNAGAPLMRWKGGDPDLGFLELTHDATGSRVTVHWRPSGADWQQRQTTLPTAGEVIDLQCFVHT
ncbi:MAG: metallophosphoesterase [Candidatus Sumerlaeia bacterium]|nr:metallophosphoesterase [Candidatus Sumerlaeia bacterium]